MRACGWRLLLLPEVACRSLNGNLRGRAHADSGRALLQLLCVAFALHSMQPYLCMGCTWVWQGCAMCALS